MTSTIPRSSDFRPSRAAPASWIAGVAITLSSTLLPSAQAQTAWQLGQVLDQTDVGYSTGSGFGRALAMSDDGWLAVGVVFGECAGGPSSSGSVEMYRYDETRRRYMAHQRLCDRRPAAGAAFGRTIAIDGDQMIVGAPRHDLTPGDGIQSGRVVFFELDQASGQWRYSGGSTGAADGLLGSSVAMDGGVAVAGEPGHQSHVGRVRSWRLAPGNWTAENAIASPGGPGEGFGSYVTLDIRNCRAPSCQAPLDAVGIVGTGGYYTAARQTTGWGALNSHSHPFDVDSAFLPTAMNDSIALAPVIMGNISGRQCGPANAVAVRVYRRLGGSAALQPTGWACNDKLALPSGSGRFAQALATAPSGSEFFVGTPDLPASTVGSVSTWTASSAGVSPTDLVTDLDYTPASNPLVGDYYGIGLAMQPGRLAVGATGLNGLTSSYVDGYVAIYDRRD